MGSPIKGHMDLQWSLYSYYVLFIHTLTIKDVDSTLHRQIKAVYANSKARVCPEGAGHVITCSHLKEPTESV